MSPVTARICVGLLCVWSLCAWSTVAKSTKVLLDPQNDIDKNPNSLSLAVQDDEDAKTGNSTEPALSSDRISQVNESVFIGGFWLTHDKHKYYFHVSTGVRHFGHAKKECKKMKAKLASILSKEENDFISGITKFLRSSAFWIGLHRFAGDDSFEWVDNSDLDFTNWNRGEPNGHTGNGQCVHVHRDGGKWNDEHCDKYTTGYICKKRI